MRRRPTRKGFESVDYVKKYDKITWEHIFKTEETEQENSSRNNGRLSSVPRCSIISSCHLLFADDTVLGVLISKPNTDDRGR